MYKSIRSFALGGTIVFMSSLGIVMTAIAANLQTYNNHATGKCLDSNAAGKVYTLDCNNGNYQKWDIKIITPYRELKNLATGKCLDSNIKGKVYTLDCNNGSYQKWQ
jgi:hypothetical protein